MFLLCFQLENTVGGEQAYQQRVTRHLVPCVGQFSAALADESQWKTLNYQVLLKTRHSNAKVRTPALSRPLLSCFYQLFVPLLLRSGPRTCLTCLNLTVFFSTETVSLIRFSSFTGSSSDSGAFLGSVDADGVGVEAEGELHGAAAGDHSLPGWTDGGWGQTHTLSLHGVWPWQHGENNKTNQTQFITWWCCLETFGVTRLHLPRLHEQK